MGTTARICLCTSIRIPCSTSLPPLPVDLAASAAVAAARSTAGQGRTSLRTQPLFTFRRSIPRTHPPPRKPVPRPEVVAAAAVAVVAAPLPQRPKPAAAEVAADSAQPPPVPPRV